MERQILHVDVNNAFLSWTAVERLKNGETEDIRNIEAVIGGDEEKRTGVVLAKSIKAKERGVTTGEPIFSARKKCRNLKTFSPDFKVYKYYSDKLYELLSEYTDVIERFSIDECFLDLTHSLMGRKLIDIAYEIKNRAKEELGFTVNIGVANNKLLAKMASDFKKPDMVHTLYKEEIESKMWNLPVNELFMLGRKSSMKFNSMQIRTIGDLAKTDRDRIYKKFGKNGLRMWEYANGIDMSEVENKESLPKGIGNSVTLPKDISGEKEIIPVIAALVEKVMYRLRAYNMQATTVNVQLKTKNFEVYSHQKSFSIPTDSTIDVLNLAKQIYKEMDKDYVVRLVGIRVDKLSKKENMQLSLFDSQIKKENNVDKVMDKLNNKFGYSTVKRATDMEIDIDI